MKRLLFTLFVFFSTISLWAKIGPGIKLQFASGNQVTILLEEQPLFKIEDNEIIITTSKREIRCGWEELQKYTYVNIDKSSIDNVEINEVHMSFTEFGISVENLQPYSDIFVYSQGGNLVYQGTTNALGCANIDLNAQTGVVYIIKTSSATLKMTKL